MYNHQVTLNSTYTMISHVFLTPWCCDNAVSICSLRVKELLLLQICSSLHNPSVVGSCLNVRTINQLLIIYYICYITSIDYHRMKSSQLTMKTLQAGDRLIYNIRSFSAAWPVRNIARSNQRYVLFVRDSACDGCHVTAVTLHHWVFWLVNLPFDLSKVFFVDSNTPVTENKYLVQNRKKTGNVLTWLKLSLYARNIPFFLERVWESFYDIDIVCACVRARLCVHFYFFTKKKQLIKRIGYLEMVYTMIYAWKEIKGDSS